MHRRAQLEGANHFPSQVLFFAERGGTGSTSADIPYTVAVVYSKFKWEQLDVVAPSSSAAATATAAGWLSPAAGCC